MINKRNINNFVYYIFNGKYILINPSNGKWIVFNEYEKLNIFVSSINTEHYKDFCVLPSQYKNLTLQFYVTNKCNLRCSHCYMRCENGMKNELSFDESIKLLDDFRACGGEKVIFTGGEVALVQQFIEIVKYSKQIGLFNMVITNGTLWSDGEISTLSNFVDRIQISVDGYDEESNSQIRGKNVFQKAINCIEKFLDLNVEVIMGLTPMYDYESDFDKYVSFCKSMLEKHVDKKLLIDFPDWLLNGRNIVADPQKNEQYQKTSKRLLNNVFPNCDVSIFKEQHNVSVQNCNYGKIVVDSNGDFAFCTCIKEIPKFGNIKNIDMKEIFHIAEIISKKTCVDNMFPCKNCDFRYICGGGCKMGNYYNCDKINSIEIPKLTRKISCEEDKINNFLNLMTLSADNYNEDIGGFIL